MNAIPTLPPEELSAVAAVPIHENGDELVPLSLAPEKILVRSAYHEAKMADALPECYARREVQQRLFAAAGLLPEGLRLVILDGWRSTALQQALFDQCRAYYRHLHPQATETELDQMATAFVATPSKSAQAPSPHLTGGAIDLCLARSNGLPLFFGAPFDFAGEISWTRHFEERLERGETLTERESDALHNRRLLYEVMTAAGFANYAHEWWHFEYGTQRHALICGEKAAQYGPAEVRLQSFAVPE